MVGSETVSGSVALCVHIVASSSSVLLCLCILVSSVGSFFSYVLLRFVKASATSLAQMPRIENRTPECEVGLLIKQQR